MQPRSTKTTTQACVDIQPDQDVLIIGGGFSGISALYRVRKLGLRGLILEAGSGFGGVWHWNRYPGARVDSEYPFYQLNVPESHKGFNFAQRFPDHHELRRYMDHLANTLSLHEHAQLNTTVVSCTYSAAASLWTVKSADGRSFSAKYLICATGLLHRSYSPDFPGVQSYKGEIYHSSSWPDQVSFAGKRVCLVGAGATAVQITQEVAKETADGGSLTVAMRRPSTCVPMRQRTLSKQDNDILRGYYSALLEKGRQSHCGFPISNAGCGLFTHSPEQRNELFEELWERGAFNFLLGGYIDTAIDVNANNEVYAFWANKVRARISDPRKKDLMAPLKPMYPFASKRPPLENDYYECLDMKHVEIISVIDNPLERFTASGITFSDGTHKDFDAVVLATGFDSFTGSLFNLGLTNRDGVDIKETWRDGVRTYLGMFMSGFPNAFILYSPHAPTAFSNGPTIIECQCDYIVDVIDRLEKQNAKSIEPTAEAEDEWQDLIDSMMEGSLMASTDSWWNGGNIPGKKKQVMTFAGGIPQYETLAREKLDGWKGFIVQ
ncbi:hypothetical protein CERZMDRAFT_39098 [Cercospora zeae-maydis SCOH1-5]|uniref:FAD/NAD(P)-binding domain-containing protein n=1 Tax=Cercospora zeae-maydis SCOH1-5 TaxID=717836 RepID=A0A6A6FKA2_9PEZI|nr:hypothetical protein CERZMDRAFT_39098 [Cercospora zeae-maydis SCOH1-5]